VKRLWLTLPDHLRRGLFRLYVAVTIPWVAWFGYMAFDADQQAKRAQIRSTELLRQMERSQNDSVAAQAQKTVEGLLGSTYQEDFEDDIKLRDEQTARRKIAVYALPAVPLGGPLLCFVVVWVVAGFRKPS
jgi:hypothetical protein